MERRARQPLSTTTRWLAAAGGREVSRRRLLAMGAALGVAGLGAGPFLARRADRAAADTEFFEPAVRGGRDGLLDTTLEARNGPVVVAGRQVTSMVYEGAFPGPTLRVRGGDTLKLRLINRLPTITNIHVHGMHVSPLDPGDDVLLHIHPGETYDYEYTIPADHPPGLNWYHPHFHGETTEQVFGGMAGALIVEGEVDRLPGIAGLRERLLVLQATEHEPNGSTTPPSANRNQAMFMRLVNGVLNPTIDIRPGERQRWRLVNANPNAFFFLQLEGHTLDVIGQDGNPVGDVFSRDRILLSPGERVEVLVLGGAPGRYALKTLQFDTGFAFQPDVTLATMVSAGAAQAPEPLPSMPPFLDLGTVPIDERRVVTFQTLPLDRDAPVIPMATFMINNQQFDEDRVDQVMRLGATEEWVIRNATNNWHPFHIHINPFQVTQINGRPVEAHGYKDTVAVPPLGEVTMRTRFLDFTGKYVFHCHILQHEDGGMMSVVEVR